MYVRLVMVGGKMLIEMKKKIIEYGIKLLIKPKGASNEK